MVWRTSCFRCSVADNLCPSQAVLGSMPMFLISHPYFAMTNMLYLCRSQAKGFGFLSMCDSHAGCFPVGNCNCWGLNSKYYFSYGKNYMVIHLPTCLFMHTIVYCMYTYMCICISMIYHYMCIYIYIYTYAICKNIHIRNCTELYLYIPNYNDLYIYIYSYMPCR